MLRPAFAIFSLLSLHTALAGGLDWTGLWEGSLGEYRITVCNNGGGMANYHRTDQGEPFALQQIDDQWQERDKDALWTLIADADGSLNGTRMDASTGTTQPIRLSRLPLQAAPSACGSLLYQATLATLPILVTGRKQTFENYYFRTLSAQPGPYPRIKAVTVEVVDERPVIAELNQAWSKALPQSAQDWIDFRSCIDSSLTVEADAGLYEDISSLSLLTPRWLSLQRSLSSRCGGLSKPRRWGYRTWDLEQSQEVDVWSWFNLQEAFPAQPYQRGWGRLSPALYRLILRDSADEEGCQIQADSWFALRPGLLGMIFERVDVAAGCDEEMEIAYPRLQPTLSAAGKRAVQALFAMQD